MAKTHKPVGKDGIQKSRPVVGAASGLTMPLGDIISDITQKKGQEARASRESETKLRSEVKEREND